MANVRNNHWEHKFVRFGKRLFFPFFFEFAPRPVLFHHVDLSFLMSILTDKTLYISFKIYIKISLTIFFTFRIFSSYSLYGIGPSIGNIEKNNDLFMFSETYVLAQNTFEITAISSMLNYKT